MVETNTNSGNHVIPSKGPVIRLFLFIKIHVFDFPCHRKVPFLWPLKERIYLLGPEQDQEKLQRKYMYIFEMVYCSALK